jgi:hypothetical protein
LYDKQIEEIHGRRDILLKNIKELEQQHENNMKFSCDKIDGLCPYVELIK